MALPVAAQQTAAAKPAAAKATVPVTVKNFQRAESDLYFGNFVKQGGFGKLFHHRAPAPIDKQDVVRMNRDTLYSSGVFDLDDTPVAQRDDVAHAGRRGDRRGHEPQR